MKFAFCHWILKLYCAQYIACILHSAGSLTAGRTVDTKKKKKTPLMYDIYYKTITKRSNLLLLLCLHVCYVIRDYCIFILYMGM